MTAFNDTVYPGAFVSIEGIDGSGKSTLARSIAQVEAIDGRPVHVVRKDTRIGDGYIAAHGKSLSTLLWGEHSEQRRNEIPDLHWLWLAASWYALVERIEIEPRLRAGYVVVADSWFDKIRARFSLKPSPVAEQAAAAGRALRRPDLTILLDVAPEVAAERKQEFGYSECGNFDGQRGRDRENFLGYQSRVRAAYHRLADEGSWLKIDAVSVEEFTRLVTLALCQR